MSQLRLLLLCGMVLFLLGHGPCRGGSLRVLSPQRGELVAGGNLDVRVVLPRDRAASDLEFLVDGAPPASIVPLAETPPVHVFRLGEIPDGWHRLEVGLARARGAREHRAREDRGREHGARGHRGRGRGRGGRRSVAFEMTTLEAPERCENLNAQECLLPFPSSRFLVGDPHSATGYRVDLPADSMPDLVVGSLIGFLTGARSRLDPAPYNRNDGFSPTAQILMNFPGGVDLMQSDVARLDPATGNFDMRSLERDHPTVLLDAETGERILHFVENDDRASGERVTTVLRPGLSLLPGRRYIVAVRDLVHADGSPVAAEPVFAALRDRRPSSIEAVEARRRDMKAMLRTLHRHHIKTRDLILAFDFVTQSDEALTGPMLAMRDRAFDILDSQSPGEGIRVAFAIPVTPAESCAPGLLWRIVLGVYPVPNFLARDPNGSPLVPADPVGDPDQLGFLALDATGAPIQTGSYDAQFGFAVPCDALLEGPTRPLLFGHGLFGNGAFSVGSLVRDLAPYIDDLRARGLVPADVRLDYAVAGTQWSGLSSLDIKPLPSDIDFSDLSPADLGALLDFSSSFVGQLFVDFDNIGALPDRLRQGQLATLVLARHLELGSFNALAAFQAPAGTAIPEGQGVLQSGEVRYFGASLGGIMGLMFTALYPQLAAANVDVPAINFGFLVQRAKPFKSFQAVLEVIDSDPMVQLIGLGLLHELWVKGDPAGYAHHITGNTLPPLPGTSPKDVLMTVARYDQQVSTLGAQIAAATLGLRNLPGSVLTNLPGVPDVSGSMRSGHIVYDTGAYQPGTATEVFIPPAVNRPAGQDDNRCDPHALRFTIPASLAQLLRFLEPGGAIENHCNGVCDASGPLELPGGLDTACDPLAP